MFKALLTVCLAAVLASPAFAEKPVEHRGPGHMMEKCDRCGMGRKGHHEMGDMIKKCLQFADKLGLSEEQINKIKPIHREMEKKQARYRADLKIAKIDMMEIMEVKDFDLEKATAQIGKIEDIKTTHRLDMLKSMKEVRSILTEDQFKKMKKMKSMRMEGKKQPEKVMKKK